MTKFLRNLLVGEKNISSLMEFKYAMLRGEYALIMLLACIFYIILDSVNGVFEFIPFYVSAIVSGLLIVHLNRIEHYKWSTAVLLLTANTVVFLFADADHPSGGVYFFYAACSVIGIVLVGYYSTLGGWLAGLLPIALGYLSYLIPFNIIPRPSFNLDMLTINFLSNFTIGLAVSVFSVQFLIRRNKLAEKSLLESERHLVNTTNELRKSEERFELALKGTRAGIYEWDMVTNHVYVSDYWKSLLGYRPEEIVTVTLENFLERVHPDDLQRTTESVRNVVDTHHVLYQNEVRLKTKTGDYKWFLDSGIVKTDDKGVPLMSVGSLIDIQERKTAEEKIRQQNELLAKANQELDYFVYSVSHDLRAPLSSILGLTNIYSLTDNSQERDQIVKMISNRAFALDDFIREVLDYSRNSRVEVKYKTLLLRQSVAEVLEGLSHMQGFDQVDIINQVPAELEVVTDPDRLKVMLSNLIANAVNYRDQSKSSYIRICAERLSRWWSFSVEDNGIGIKPEHHEKIFDMFYKAHDRGNGSGLGLYIVREALGRLKGKIEVKSDYGKGSTFQVTLPVATVNETVEAAVNHS
ncbi:MAG: PAS domain-containing protein [Bacteroidetes bacterium]|nr:PAS domain-containing protein [Bacteroidota bacterium]